MLDIAAAGSIYFFWTQQIREVTKRQRETVAKELQDTATGTVFPNGWRTSQRTSRSQKHLHPQKLLVALIRNVLLKSGITEAQYFYSLPKDQNCEVCKRTKIIKASCRRRTGEPVRRAERNLANLITADHKVFNEGSESRHNHRHSIVVQD